LNLMDLDPKTLVATAFLVLLWAGEGLLPFYPQFQEGWSLKFRHDARNLGLGVANALFTAVGFGGVFLALEVWAEGQGFGLLRMLPDAAGWMALLSGLILFDLWMYLWHRANHEIPFLWRFHRMHHSDPAMDVTTGIRFHPGEMVLSSLARLGVLTLLGMSLWQLALYEAVLLPVILFHHSNLRFPRWIDRGLRTVVVTPAMHRVHHSRWQPETDSNYGAILPIWDRIFRTFRLREDPRTIEIGLDGFDGEAWQTLGGLLRTPLAPPSLPDGSVALHDPDRSPRPDDSRAREEGGAYWDK
jgi:sterol desaturase/sphingolipid hydroxylase (fatty acid hydroxylase superfamily)